jgi:NAD(P)H-nitrite reductase large subunit
LEGEFSDNLFLILNTNISSPRLSGSGCFGTVDGLRRGGFRGRVTVISKEPYLPIDRTKLSKALIADANKLILRNGAWFKATSVDFVLDEVTDVDFGGKKISAASGKEFPYTKLVLATGGTPRTLSIEGFSTLENIFVLRTVSDVKSINAAVGEEKGRQIVVIGSSFIGMEVAKALAGKGHKVAVVGMEKAPLERVIGAEVGTGLQKQLEGIGIKFFMEASVESASPLHPGGTKVAAVALKDGTKLPADLVILGVGVAPATEYLKGNPDVQLERDGSIKVDESFSVIGLKDVYAIGSSTLMVGFLVERC